MKYCKWKYDNGHECHARLTKVQELYSLEKYKEYLCWGHQKQTDTRNDLLKVK